MPVFIKWKPTQNFSIFDEMMSQTLDHLSDSMTTHSRERCSTWAPVADMYETDTDIVIQVELAGIDKDVLDIVFQEGCLHIQGERPLNTAMKSAKIHQIERMYGRFRRKFRIPIPIDSHEITASYAHGILHIILPKQQQSHPAHVNVPVTFT